MKYLDAKMHYHLRIVILVMQNTNQLYYIFISSNYDCIFNINSQYLNKCFHCIEVVHIYYTFYISIQKYHQNIEKTKIQIDFRTLFLICARSREIVRAAGAHVFDVLCGSVRDLPRQSQWCSLTQSAVNILVTEKLDIQKYFYGLDSADEFYKQTVLLAHNQSFYDIKNQFNGNQRHIDWSNGGPNPKTFDKSDLSVLLSIPRMFARKFNIEHMDVINAIIAKTNQKEIQPQLQQNIQDVRDISA
ncbi:Glycosyltransferase [Hexamita inflata]|uniref:Glycosyltransferase n=1 Tax=Hexamita inflata TaxID=28002 RepID=A0ABP1MJ72_9EUKA